MRARKFGELVFFFFFSGEILQEGKLKGEAEKRKKRIPFALARCFFLSARCKGYIECPGRRQPTL